MQKIASINFESSSVDVARALIGTVLLVDGVGGRIVETETYDATEPTSHSYGGRSMRNATLFGAPGHAYVNRSYGIHWCLNFVCREAGHGAGVLIRALEPSDDIDVMRARCGLVDERLLGSGPGRLGQALGITKICDGLPLDHAPFELRPSRMSPKVVVGGRIGIAKAKDMPWRFGLHGSRYVSRRFA